MQSLTVNWHLCCVSGIPRVSYHIQNRQSGFTRREEVMRMYRTGRTDCVIYLFIYLFIERPCVLMKYFQINIFSSFLDSDITVSPHCGFFRLFFLEFMTKNVIVLQRQPPLFISWPVNCKILEVKKTIHLNCFDWGTVTCPGHALKKMIFELWKHKCHTCLQAGRWQFKLSLLACYELGIYWRKIYLPMGVTAAFICRLQNHGLVCIEDKTRYSQICLSQMCWENYVFF